jgi:hypothetical protein
MASVPDAFDPEPQVANVGLAALEISSAPGDSLELFVKRS